MKFSSHSVAGYRAALVSLPFGKKVGTHLYIHRDGLSQLPSEISGLVSLGMILVERDEFCFSVIKLGIRTPSLSFLDYPHFNKQAFPILARSATVNLEQHSLRITDFRNSANPPVLHRKELLLPIGHKNMTKFSELTYSAESYGLFEHPSRIGLLNGWRQTLKEKRVKVAGHKLIFCGEPQTCEEVATKAVMRHRTAIARQHLSMPLQLLDKYGYLDGSYSIFDYGCGRGEDLEVLNNRGIDAKGWDPYFRSDSNKVVADITNLGFVINVIEDRKERDIALRESFNLARKFLVVSAMKDTPDRLNSVDRFADGGITKIGTFQKYFSADELQNYVRSTLGASVVPVSQESVIAFKNEEETNRFFARRAGFRRTISRGSKRRAEELFLLDESAREVLGSFWDRCIELGREPLMEELSEIANIGQLGLSARKAFEFLSEKFKTDELDASAERRRQDLLVEFALGFFEKRSIYKYLSADVQRDVESFFENYSSLRNEAKALLFSIADEEKLLNACQEAASEGYGYLFGDHSLQLHVDLVDKLPAILRVYAGCAQRLLGSYGSAELIKIHIQSGKISLMSYDDFSGKAIPLLLERVKVNLWNRRIEFFDYVGPHTPQPLLMKSLYIDDSLEIFKDQEVFDRKLLEHNLFDFENPHPKLEDFRSLLAAKRLKVSGYSLKQV